MFALALIALVLTAATVVTRLVHVVMNDRPLSAPRVAHPRARPAVRPPVPRPLT
jgi:hypothetical protein